MAKAITAATLKTLAATKREKRVERQDGACPGLYLIIQPSSAMTWAFRYKSPLTSRPAKLTIGDTKTFSIAEARERATKARGRVLDGIDPAEEKKAAKRQAADTSDLCGVLLNEFLAQHVRKKNRPKTIEAAEQRIRDYVRPKWANKKIRSITDDDVAELIAGIEAKPLANRVLALVSKFFNWLINERRPRLKIVSPVVGIQPHEEAARDRVLTNAEVVAIWNATDDNARFSQLTRLLLLTGQRRNEVAGMKWSELDLESPAPLWVIPKSRCKNGNRKGAKDHEVPLSPAVVDILASIPRLQDNDFVFPTRSGSGHTRDFTAPKGALDKKAGVANWRLHDLRRTADTGMNDLGVPPHIVEEILNHASSGHRAGVAGTYNHAKYLAEKRRALGLWADYVTSGCQAPAGPIDVATLSETQRTALLAQLLGGNVVPLRKEAA